MSGITACTLSDIPFYYDSARSKWLSFETHVVQLNNPASELGAHSLKYGDTPLSSSVQFTIPRNGILVGVAAKSADSSSARPQLRAGSSVLCTLPAYDAS